MVELPLWLQRRARRVVLVPVVVLQVNQAGRACAHKLDGSPRKYQQASGSCKRDRRHPPAIPVGLPGVLAIVHCVRAALEPKIGGKMESSGNGVQTQEIRQRWPRFGKVQEASWRW